MRDSMSSRWASLPPASARSSSSMSDDWAVMRGEAKAPFPAEPAAWPGSDEETICAEGQTKRAADRGRPVVTPRGEDHDEETKKMPRNEPSHRITDSSMVNEISTLFHGGQDSRRTRIHGTRIHGGPKDRPLGRCHHGRQRAQR